MLTMLIQFWEETPRVGPSLVQVRRGVLIPFAGMALVGFIIWVGMQKEKHSRSLLHKEIMNAIEKGVDVPLVKPNNTPLDYLRKGVIWALVGIGLVIAFVVEGDIEAAGIIGSVPFAIGVGYIVYYILATKDNKKA